MKLTKTYKVRDYSINSFLQKELGLSFSESKRIAEAMDSEYYIVKYNKTVKGNLFWRISGTFHFALFLLLFFVICPIKWLFTGLFYFDPKSKVYQFFQKWQDKL